MGCRDKMEIIEKIRKAIPEMKKMEYPMKRIGLFGSVLQGTDNAESDLDVLVEFFTNDRDEQVLGAIDIEERLKEFLQHPDVRVSTENDTSPVSVSSFDGVGCKVVLDLGPMLISTGTWAKTAAPLRAKFRGINRPGGGYFL